MHGVPGSSVAASWIGGSGMSVSWVIVPDFFSRIFFSIIIALLFIIADFYVIVFTHKLILHNV